MKRKFIGLILIMLFLTAFQLQPKQQTLPFELEAKSAVLWDFESGRFCSLKTARAHVPASLVRS